ncbi:hypothetical protein Fmac_032797 [Flemingia macrophylla]|uniref:Uncharacterized protein n=1 Tax=Flemingia macrophylla TaxID=520843 RepID=A0ABD1L5Y4_9FABA
MLLLQKSTASVHPMTTILVSVLLRSNLEWKSILRLMLQTPIADHHNSRDKALDREDGSQLLALRIRSLPLLQVSAASVLPMTTLLVSVLLRSNLEWMSILRLMLQTPIADHHSSRYKALDREDDSQILVLAANQKPTSVTRVCVICSSNDHHVRVCPSSQQSGLLSARNDAIVIRGVDDVARDTSVETRKLEGKLDALVNLVTQLATNQKPASIARVCGIRSSNDHHTSVCPFSQQSGVDEHPEAYAANTYRRPPQQQRQGVHDVATDISIETRKLEGKQDTPLNLVTQLATNQKPASIVRVCGIRSSNDHHTGVCPSLLQYGVDEHLEAYTANTYSRPPQLKLEGKLDAHVNLVSQLAANQKHATFAKVCDIRSSNDHHTNVCPFSQQSGVDEHPEAFVANTYSRPLQQGVHVVGTDISAKTIKLESKLSALVNLVTQLATNQKLASIARVCGIRPSNDHYTSVYPSSQQSGVDEHPEAYAANTYSRPPQVHDVATDASIQTRKLEGKQDALVNLVTQLATNQKPASVAKVFRIRSSNDHHTSVCPSSQQSGVDEHPEAYATNACRRPPQGVHVVAIDTSVETRKLEGKQDALVNLQSGVDEHPEAYAAKTYIRPPQQQRQGTG